jgi:hypothetical protein
MTTNLNQQLYIKSHYELITLTCEKFLFLAVPIFRHAIFGSVLLAVPDIFHLFIFFKRTAIFSMSIFSSAIISKYGRHAG